MPGELRGYIPPEAKITQNNSNINNMPEITPKTQKETSLEAAREAFDKRMFERAEKLAKKLSSNDATLIERLKNDLTQDYTSEENVLRQENPEESSKIYENSKAMEKLIVEKVLAGLDSLTGINNRLSLDQQVERRQQEVKEKGEFSMIMIDIDKFKNVNDTYGHQGGDYILREVAQTLKKDMRHGDLLARYGGEEIVVIAPNANGDAVGFAERLRKKIEETKFNYKEQDIKITISAGVSPYDENFEKMKENSDIGLYLAKGAGDKLTKNVKVEQGHEGEKTRDQVWYFDKENGEFKKNK